MTLGNRIQQYRKARGLSQEALGEALGVSRQAISKWESDLTIPEIDKLIALSRLFGVSVGALLGEEEPSDAGGELTDREWEAVEAVAERYLSRTRPKRGEYRVWLSLAVLAAAAILIFWVKGRLDDLDGRMNTLQNNVSNISGSVSGRIDAMADQIQDLLTREASLLSDVQCSVTAVDIAGQTMLVDLSATPKAYTDGMVMRFSAEPAGEALLTAEVTADADHTFRLSGWELPLNDEIRLSATFGANESWQTQALETLTGWQRASCLRLDVEHGGSSGLTFAQWSVDWELKGHFSAEAIAAPLVPESARMEVRKNGAVIDSLELELTCEDGKYGFSQDAYRHTARVADGDTLEYGVRYTDNYGRERFCAVMCVTFQTDGTGNLDYGFQAQADSIA